MIRLNLTHFVLVAASLDWITQCLAVPTIPKRDASVLPRRTIAGVSVVDNQLIRDAQQFARDHGDLPTYNHIMRSWLFGVLLVQGNATLSAQVDQEVHAVAAILHDVGFDRTPNSSIVSRDRRFEIDGAIAARDFLHRHPAGQTWDKQRVQLMFNAIALHAEIRIAPFMEPLVQVTSDGINVDFKPNGGGDVAPEQHAAIVAEFPMGDLLPIVKDTFIWICTTKPESTYDTWMQAYGERLVANYSAVGHRVVDKVLGPP